MNNVDEVTNPQLPEIYRADDPTIKIKDGYRSAFRELPERMIDAIITTPMTRDHLPPVIDTAKASAMVPYRSDRLHRLRPFTATAAAIGGLSGLVTAVALHNPEPFFGGALVAIIAGSLFGGGGRNSDYDHHLIMWYKWASVQKLTYWLETQYGIHAREYLPRSDWDIPYLVQRSQAGSVKVIDDNNITYLIARNVQDGPLTVTDMAFQPAQALAINPAPQTVKADPLPADIRERLTHGQTLHAQLAKRTDLTTEQSFIIDRAQKIMSEAVNIATTLQTLPATEQETVYGALSRSIEVAITDLEEIQQAHVKTAIRQAKVLDLYTQQLP